MIQPLRQLEVPPITEVVCGISFRPVPGLDPVVLGAYWKERREDFPRREFKRPLTTQEDAVEVSMGPDLGPIRTWLVSRDDVFILQIQHDRFYLNWRARADAYPRFNDWDGNRGLLSRFMGEVQSFDAFCSRDSGERLELTGLELTKIDHLERGRHWKDARDLSKLVPMLASALDFQDDEPQIQIRLSSRRADGRADVAIDSLLKLAQPPIPVVQLQFRRLIDEDLTWDELESRFRSANRELNDELFLRLLPAEEHHRFAKGWTP